MLFLLARTAIRWSSLSRLRKEARLISAREAVRIYQVDRKITPFSFGNAIFINPRLHTEKEWEEIVLHEYVHIRQRHTLDILLAEAITIVNWYNPFAWALRHSIRQNLEFIADQQVLDKGVDKKEYQYHLLKVMGHPPYRLANNFNFTSLKKRIIMMNKIRTARVQLLRLLFWLPLLAVILLAFRTAYPDILHRRGGPVYVNAAGIVISLPDKTPLAGATVREKRTGLQTVTDAHGYFKLHIPVTGDSVRVRLDYSKPGYEAIHTERSWPRIRETKGLIDVAPMATLAPHQQELFMAAPNMNAEPPADPDYGDATHELQRVLAENVQFSQMLETKNAHPEIGLFYVTEDKQKRLVIHTDGSVERYGYPGTPSLTEMDKKYGVLPWMGPEGANPNKGYLARWAAISAQAEKEFHPTGGNPRAILFPGDSRVIAVPTSGKPRIYDMDNNDPVERPAFEKLYGKLPPCVPEPGNAPARPSAVPADTTPVPTVRISEANKALLLVDGVEKNGRAKDSIDPRQIASTSIFTPDQAYRLFGERGRNGVIAIITNAYAAGHAPLPGVPVLHPKSDPIYFIDSTRLPEGPGWASLISPDHISSVQVLKSSPDLAQYGPDAVQRGVLIIHTRLATKQP
jgi:hypothetical protein